jgi:hypothetical protein
MGESDWGATEAARLEEAQEGWQWRLPATTKPKAKAKSKSMHV